MHFKLTPYNIKQSAKLKKKVAEMQKHPVSQREAEEQAKRIREQHGKETS